MLVPEVALTQVREAPLTQVPEVWGVFHQIVGKGNFRSGEHNPADKRRVPRARKPSRHTRAARETRHHVRG